MLDASTTFNEVIQHFPKWMDIRKRPTKSDGGRYLKAIVDELDDIQQAIVDFKKDYFIISYIGREDTVIDYLWIGHVGDIAAGDFTLIDPAFTVVYSTQDFYFATDPVCLFQDGYVFFKPGDLPSGTTKAKYSYNDYNYGVDLTYTHIWNVLDEFAMFSGLTRYDGEKNAELLNRTLLAFKNPTNSTEAGIKNAIINAVANYDPLTADDITIEQQNQANLEMADSEYGSVIERLAQLNKDIYRTKKWDKDTWEHSFKTIDYVPHKWDAPVANYQDGVGHNDAVVSVLTDDLANCASTDVEIDAYQKSEVQINEYIRNQKIETDINLGLTKYNNVLKPKEVQYKITASDVVEITDADVFFNCYRVSSGESHHFIEDLLLNNTAIPAGTIIERGRLIPNTNYKVKFFPETDMSDMQISKCLLKNNTSQTSLLVEKGAYKFNEYNVLTNTNIKLHLDSTRDMVRSTNLVDVKDGIALADVANDGFGKIDLTGMDNQYLQVSYDCREVTITKDLQYVQAKGFVLNDVDELVSNNASDELTIDITCNQLTYEMSTGNCLVTKTINGVLQAPEIWYQPKTDHMRFDAATRVQITIKHMGNQELIIRNISYASYEIGLALDHGTLSNILGTRIIPATGAENALNITIKAHTAFSPVINYVHVGSSSKNFVYETAAFNSGSDPCYLDISSDCRVELIQLDGAGKVVATTDNYITKNSYQNNTSENIYLMIDTSGFLDITYTEPELSRTSYGTSMVYYVTLHVGETLDQIKINGDALQLITKVDLKSILCPHGEPNQIYASKALRGFVLKNGTTEQFVQVSKSQINGAADVVKICNLPDRVSGSFVVDQFSDVESMGSMYDKAFQYVYLYPLDAKEYVAYNKVNMIRDKETGIEIVDVFNPLLPAGIMMLYVIDFVSSDATYLSIDFEKTDNSETYWSLGRKTLSVAVDMEMNNDASYQLDLKQLSTKFALSDNIELDSQYAVEGATVELAQYIIIPPAGMKVIYENKTYEEKVVVEDDKFNKLKYSNITNITSMTGDGISMDEAQLLNEPGIITWANSNHVGKTIDIQYVYKSPKYLTFSDLDRLYQLVGYTTQAYKNIYTTTLHGVSGEVSIEDLDIPQDADRIITNCSNPSFIAKIVGDTIQLTKISSDNQIAVRSGFFYQDGSEYYQFTNKKVDPFYRMSNIDLYNTKRLNNELIFNQTSTNYLPDTRMTAARMHEICNVDFVNNDNIFGESRLDALTACDTFNFWSTFAMNVTFSSGINGMGIHFEPTTKDGYGLLEISRYLQTDNLLTFSASGALKVSVAKEVKYHDITSYDESILVEPYLEIGKSGDYYAIDLLNLDSDYRYFLSVEGEGTLDDVIIKNYVAGESLSAVHTKNIDTMGFSITEKAVRNYIHAFSFDKLSNVFHGLQIEENGLISVGMSVDYGMTKIFETRTDWSKCIIEGLEVVQDYVAALHQDGYVETPAVYLPSKGSARSLLVKVNDLLEDKLKGFTISIYSSDHPYDGFVKITDLTNTNILSAFQNRLLNYVKVRVEAAEGKVINNVELFMEYVQNEVPLRVVPNRTGYLLTKIYDATFAGNFKVRQIEADSVKELDQLQFFVRGCREDSRSMVWTDWKEIDVDANLNAVNDVEFQNYQFFQFKIVAKNQYAEIRINKVDFEVIA